jgi:hypothetical protein
MQSNVQVYLNMRGNFRLVVPGIRPYTIFMTKKSRDFNRQYFLGADYVMIRGAIKESENPEAVLG